MYLKPCHYFTFTLAALLLAGCAKEREAALQPRAITDALGRTITLPGPVERAVSLAPNLTEIVFAAGAGHKLVGVTTADNYPPAVDTLPHVGALPLNFEAVAALAPDLVLANANVNNPRDADTFAALGIPVYYFAFEDLAGVLRGIRTAGDLLGTAARAARTADSLAAEIDALRRLTDTAAARPLTLFLISDDVLYAFGRESYMHAVIALAGGRSATVGVETERPVLSDEFVLTTKPEVIVGSFGADYNPARLLARHPTWDIVPAVREGRVYSVDPDFFLRPSPRLVAGARRLAALLHPALFPVSDEATPQGAP